MRERVNCSTVQCSAVQCSAVQYSTVQYSASTLHCSKAQCTTMKRITQRLDAPVYSIIKSFTFASSNRKSPQPLIVDRPTRVFLYCLLLILELQHIRKPGNFGKGSVLIPFFLFLFFSAISSRCLSTWPRNIGWTDTPQAPHKSGSHSLKK